MSEMERLEARLRALGAAPWPKGSAVQVRMAVHTGEAELRELLDADFAKCMIERINVAAFPPQAMVVEITETFLLQDMGLARRHIERLAEAVFGTHETVHLLFNNAGVGIEHV